MVRSRLRSAGVSLGGHGDPIEVLVGPWSRLRADAGAALIERGPATSGVFADFEKGPHGYSLETLHAESDVAERLGTGTGLVAAVRDGDRPPTWVVAGTDSLGTRRAAGLLDTADLRDRYAVAADSRGETPLPVP
jgi:hypothetical protein